ncbi:MAG: hypothetical protein V4603_07685, partial [Pseudomonadota bacterium]
MMLSLLLALPFAGAIACSLTKAESSLRISFAVLLLFLLGSVAAMLMVPPGSVDADALFVLDALAAPLLPVFAFVHLLSHLGTAKTVTTPGYCVRSLLAAGLSALALTSHNDNLLMLMLILSIGLPLWELRDRGRSGRAFFLYMLAFCVLMFASMLTGLAERTPLSVGLLLLALIIRGGLFPAHSWLPLLFTSATYGTSLLFILPLMEILVVIRVLLMAIPEWMLEAIGILCLVSAVYCGGMAMVQVQVSRFFAFLCLS